MGPEEKRRVRGRGSTELKDNKWEYFWFRIVCLHLWHLVYFSSALIRHAHKTEWCELFVSFSHLCLSPANHPVRTESCLHNSTQMVDNDTFFGRVQTLSVITDYKIVVFYSHFSDFEHKTTGFPALTWLRPVICSLLSTVVLLALCWICLSSCFYILFFVRLAVPIPTTYSMPTFNVEQKGSINLSLTPHHHQKQHFPSVLDVLAPE